MKALVIKTRSGRLLVKQGSDYGFFQNGILLRRTSEMFWNEASNNWFTVTLTGEKRIEIMRPRKRKTVNGIVLEERKAREVPVKKITPVEVIEMEGTFIFPVTSDWEVIKILTDYEENFQYGKSLVKDTYYLIRMKNNESQYGKIPYIVDQSDVSNYQNIPKLTFLDAPELPGWYDGCHQASIVLEAHPDFNFCAKDLE